MLIRRLVDDSGAALSVALQAACPQVSGDDRTSCLVPKVLGNDLL